MAMQPIPSNITNAATSLAKTFSPLVPVNPSSLRTNQPANQKPTGALTMSTKNPISTSAPTVGPLTPNNGQIPFKAPVSVVSTKHGTDLHTKITNTTDNQNKTNADAAANRYDPNNPNKLDANGKLYNPPGAQFDRNTGNNLKTGLPPTKTTATETTPESTILNQPDTNMQEAYNTRTGQREDQPSGTLPPGYVSQNPMTRTDVSGTATPGDGNTFKQFSDGTFGRFDDQGNYSPATAASFAAAQSSQSINDKITAINNGTYQLPPNQQAILNGISSKYAALIKAQETENANTTGTMTIAQNMYGMGNTLTGKGEITKTVNDGLDKIKALTDGLANDLATMTASLEKDDYAQLKDSWDSYEGKQAQLQNDINATEAATAAAEKKTKEDATQNKIDMAVANLYSQGVRDPIKIMQALEKQGVYATSAQVQSTLGVVGKNLADNRKQLQDVVNNAQSVKDYKTAEKLLKLDPESPTFQNDLAKLQGGLRAQDGGSGSGTGAGGNYIIKSGDDLWHIAQKYGVTVDAMRAANPSINENGLKPGQKINLPPNKPSDVSNKSLTGTQLKETINSMIASPSFQSMTDDQKKSYIQSQGGTPSDYEY